MKIVWIYRVLHEDGKTLKGYEMIKETRSQNSHFSKGFGEFIREIRAISKLGNEEVGVVFRPPYDIVVTASGYSCSEKHKALNNREIKDFIAMIEA